MLAWRLDAYKRWLTMREPKWAKVEYGPIDYQDLYYYSAPKKKDGPKSLDEIDPEILRTYEKLGIPLREREALLGIQKSDGDGGEDGAEAESGSGYGESRSMRCSIRFRSPPRSRRNWPRPACCSCRSRKRSKSIPNW